MSILVYTENWEGKFKKLSFELVSYANEMAKQLSTEVVALSIGNVDEAELKSLGQYGASKVLNVNDAQLANLSNAPYARVIAEAAEKEAAQVIVFAHNNGGKALAPRVSVKLKAGLVSGVAEAPSSYDPFTVKKKPSQEKPLQMWWLNQIRKLSLLLKTLLVYWKMQKMQLLKPLLLL